MHRLLTAILPIALLAACATSPGGPGTTTGAPPEWVERNGTSTDFPSGRYLVGFATALGGEQGLESARQQAAGDLARQISVQIESSVVDVTRESRGRLENDLTSQIRATSDIRLEGVRFETYATRKKAWALAVLERLPAAQARRQQRDRALAETRRCLDGAAREEEAGRSRQALAAYRACRRPLNEAIEHEAVAAALLRGRLLDDAAADQLSAHAVRIDERVRALPHDDARSISSAAEGLALQLGDAGVGRGRNIEVPPFCYQSRDVSSPFGREIAAALESAVGRTQADGAASGEGAVVLRGSYSEEGDRFQLRVNAKQASSGVLLASAELSLMAGGIPKGMETRPANFDRFTADADLLAGGEVVSGDLRIELRTDRGTRGIVYDEGEELRLFLRVNQPAWIRLIYVLTSGEAVPIDQAWFIGSDQVNQLVEYPDSFEIVPPFGVEMIHAMAYTERPERLVTRTTRIDGQPYEVIAEGTEQVARHRGIMRKKKRQVAEQTLQLTTMRGAR
jgi:hypothetical protein